MIIRPADKSDSNRILDIYRQGIETRNATFETEVPDWETWDALHHSFCRLVYEENGTVMGWAALSPVSRRLCYRGVAEVSIYIDAARRGRGIGGRLLKTLIAESEKHGIWSLNASIFAENRSTHRLHLRHGFREVGFRERIAQLDGIWRDTLILERRSDI